MSMAKRDDMGGLALLPPLEHEADDGLIAIGQRRLHEDVAPVRIAMTGETRPRAQFGEIGREPIDVGSARWRPLAAPRR